jgi:hypothetical protein
MPNPQDASFVRFMRAFLALALTAILPVLLWVNVSRSSDLVQAYQDALAAVVAFYFGATSSPD